MFKINIIMQKIFYSILLLGATQTVWAQIAQNAQQRTSQNTPQRTSQSAPQNTPQDPQQIRFNTAIEYMNCRLGEFSMDNSADAKLKNTFMQSCPCRKEGGTNAALSHFFQANKLPKNTRLFRSVDSLKNTYVAGTPPEQLGTRLSSFLSSGTMVQFAHNKTGYTDFSRSLAQEIEARFPANGAAPTSNTSSNYISEPNDGAIGEVAQEKQSSFIKFFTYLITLLLGVLIGAVALRFWQRDTTRKKNTSSSNNTQAAISTFFGGSNENNNTNYNNNTSNNNAQITNLEQQVTDLRKQTERENANNLLLRKQIDELSHQIKTTKIETQTLDKEQFVSVAAPTMEFDIAPTSAPAFAPYIMYMRIPTRDGLFNDARRSDTFKSGESVYKFVINAPNIANYSMVEDDETMLRAIQAYNIYIEPACEAVNTPDVHATQIRNLQSGKAVKEGEVWRIIDKAHVEIV